MERCIVYKILFAFLVSGLLHSCSPTRYVGKDERLLSRVKIKIEDKKINGAELRKNIRQKPNTRILGVARFHLGLYNLSGRNENRSLNKWLRAIGEAPVIYSPFLTDRSKMQMETYLCNKGYYHAIIRDTVWFRKKRAFVEYRVIPGRVTVVKEFDFQDKYQYVRNELADTTLLMRKVLADTVNTLLHPDMPMDMELMEKERDRITRMLRENGYFNFSKNFIQYYADTTLAEGFKVARLLLTVVNNLQDSAAYRTYRIGDIRINLDYDPLLMITEGRSAYRDTLFGDYGISYREKLKISPKVIMETLQLNRGDLYDMRRVTDSYSRLQALNLFKFINIVFKEKKNADGEVVLDCEVQLTPVKRQSYHIFLEGTNNSGNIGVGGNLTYNHRNMFCGAENLSLSVWGALKKEQINELKFFSTTELGVELKLITPQFWLPFLKLKDFRRNYAPKSSISLSYSFEETPFYARRIVSAKFGYLWRQADRRWRYGFDLVDLNYVLMQQVDAGFISGLKNEYVKSAYTDHMILSANFSAVYTDQILNTRNSYNYFRSNLETSGNFLSALSRIGGVTPIEQTSEESYHTMLGVRYAQFVKIDGEYRYCHYTNRINTMVYRFFLGCGYPYGNMKVLPFEEAYFCGGANDLRAWQSRTLGPGSYVSGDRYPNNVGDLKIGFNAEYRFKLFWALEGALFLDAGNIWNINKFEDRFGTRLSSDIYRQFAVGTGVGLRFDLNFFLLRFDLGIKMVDPAQPEKRRFVLLNNQGGFRRSVFNIAIGYPF